MLKRSTNVIQKLSVLILLALLPACSAGPRNYINDNDHLRREVTELREENAEFKTSIEAIKARLAAEQIRHGVKLPEGMTQPKLSRLALHGYSGGIDTNSDGSDDTVRLYLETLDSRGRFVQTIAKVDVTITATVPGKAATTIVTKSFTPKEFDTTYRAGLTGTHYTLVIPVTHKVPAGVGELTVAIKVTDLTTKQSFDVLKTITWSSK